MLEKEMFYKFKEFGESGFTSEAYEQNENINTIHNEFYFTSCGDDFFRNKKKIENLVLSINNKYIISEFPKKTTEITVNNEKYISNSSDLFMFNFQHWNSNRNNKIVTFNVCRIDKIPFYSNIKLTESYSNNQDLHIMFHNKQMLGYKIKYIWLFLKWVKINEVEYRWDLE